MRLITPSSISPGGWWIDSPGYRHPLILGLREIYRSEGIWLASPTRKTFGGQKITGNYLFDECNTF